MRPAPSSDYYLQPGPRSSRRGPGRIHTRLALTDAQQRPFSLGAVFISRRLAYGEQNVTSG